MDNLNSIKRKCKSPSQIKSAKRSYVEVSKINILHFPDCILLHVLQYLDTTSLYHLGRSCTRFESLVQDKSLWIHVEGRSQPNSTDKLEFCWQNINKKTKRLLLSGSRRSQVVFLGDVLNSDKLNNLTVLALEHQYIKYCKFKNFPSSLQEVSFKHSYIAHNKYFFNDSHTYCFGNPDQYFFKNFDRTSSMPNLQTLILDHCQWFTSQNLLDICCYPKLEILSLYMCKKLLRIDPRRKSGIGKQYFKSLKVIDLRFTGLDSSFLNYFFNKPSIQVIYFQCFATTYYLERYKRKLDIVHGMKMHEYSHVSDDEDNNDTSTYSLNKRFGAINWREYNGYDINDTTMEQFKYLKPVQESKAKPSSYLYTYPYDECKCGFFDETSGTSDSGDFASDVPSNNDDNQLMSSTSLETGDWDPEHLQYKLEKEIKNCKTDKNIYFILPSNIHTCRKVLFDLCSNPEWCQVQSSPKTCSQNWLYAREPKNDYEIAMLEHYDLSMFDTNKLCIFRHTNEPLTSRFGRTDNQNLDCDCNNTKSRYRNEGTEVWLMEQDLKNVDDSVKYLIRKVSDCIRRLQTCQYPENEAMTVVNELLHVLDLCLIKQDIFQLFSDADFVRLLCMSFYRLSRSMRQDIHHVLNYHCLCFKQLVTQLNYSDDSKRKYFLKRFFNNLICSDSHDVHVQSNKVETDKLNNPGPSGLQPPLESMSFHQNIGIRDNETSAILISSRSNSDEMPFLPPELINRLPQQPKEHSLPTNLKEISCRGYPHVTDKTLMLLQNMNLDLLDVTGTNVTRAGAQQFIAYNPQCRLIHETACRCRPSLHF